MTASSTPQRATGSAAILQPDGLLRGARQLPSPNQDERADPEDVSLLVIHNISLPPDRFGGPWIDALFTNTLDPKAHPYFETIHTLRVSAHLWHLPRRPCHAVRALRPPRLACRSIELRGS